MSAHIITETAIAVVLLAWLVWLTATVTGHHDRIDGAVDVADRALAARQTDDEPVTRGRHAARPTPGPRDNRLKESA